MALAPDLRNALVKREDLFGVVLHLVEHYAAGSWMQADESARALGSVVATSSSPGEAVTTVAVDDTMQRQVF